MAEGITPNAQKKRAPMSEKDLLAAIGQYEKAALGSTTAAGPTVSSTINPAGQQMTTLEVDRFNALNAYFGRPLGNEVSDRSQVVFPELRDTVEWVMPQLMRIFAANQRPCQFDPEGEDDEEQAEVETQVVNHVFMKMNDGFFVLHDMFKDALLLRNGYANVYWEQRTHTEIETYSGLTEIELADVLEEDDDTEIEILGQREYEEMLPAADNAPHPMAPPMPQGQPPQPTGAPSPMGAPGQPPGAPQMPQAIPPLGPVPTTLFDVKIRRTSRKGQVCVECAPPEEMLVSPQARKGFDQAPFVEHKTPVMRSKLIEDGFDAMKVAQIAISQPTWLNLVSLAREEVTDELSEEEVADPASQMVDKRIVYIRIDFDGDGISELRRVIMGGDVILDNEECEEPSFAWCAPMRMPHRHVGISYYDILFDLQVIKTTLWRQGLDNLYLANNQRTAVDASRANVADLLISRPGGVVRTNGPPADVLMPIVSPTNVMGQIMPALDYCDRQREMRTGIGTDTMGVDADALQDVTKGGQLAAMSAAAMKVELVARMLAEGVRDMFGKIHRLMIRHHDDELTLQIAGKWVTVKPSEWRTRTKVSVNVGLGSGTREEQRANLMMLMQLQDKTGAAIGTPTYKYHYETFRQAAHLLGYESPERYLPAPDSPEAQQIGAMKQAQGSQDPRAISAQAQVKIAGLREQTAQQKIQADQQIEGDRMQLERMKAQAAAANDQRDSARELQVSREDRVHDMALQLIKVIGGIVASQLKQDTAANAGQVLADDVRTAQSGGIQ